MSEQTLSSDASSSNLVPWDRFLNDLGLDRSTGYRYRKRGLLIVLNLFGRLYITRDEIARFEGRVAAGEFAVQRKSPFRADPEVSQVAHA